MGHESEKVPRFFLSTLGLCSGLATMGSAAFSESILRYDSVYLTCSKKLTGSQLSLPHKINKNIQNVKLKINWWAVWSHYQEKFFFSKNNVSSIKYIGYHFVLSVVVCKNGNSSYIVINLLSILFMICYSHICTFSHRQSSNVRLCW